MTSILFILIFMMRALPVMHWINDTAKEKISMEITDEKDSDEKDNTAKEQFGKEHIIPQKNIYSKYLAFKSVRLIFPHSENAITLHHAEVNTPPPDIKA